MVLSFDIFVCIIHDVCVHVCTYASLFVCILSTSNTSFQLLMQNNVNVVPVFGTSFQVYMPICMVIVALFTFFNVMSRLFALIGIETEEGKGDVCWSTLNKDGQRILNEEDAEKYDSGKSLILAELRLNPTNSGSNNNSRIKLVSTTDNALELSERGSSGKSKMATNIAAAPVVKLTSRDARIYRDLQRDDNDDDADNDNGSSSSRHVGSSSGSSSRNASFINRGRRPIDDDEEDEYDFMKYVNNNGSPVSTTSTHDRNNGDVESGTSRLVVESRSSTSTLPTSATTTSTSTTSSWLGKLGFSTSVEGRSVKEKSQTLSPLHGSKPSTEKVSMPMPMMHSKPVNNNNHQQSSNPLPSSSASAQKSVQQASGTGSLPHSLKPLAKPSTTQHQTFFDMLDDELENDGGGRYD